MYATILINQISSLDGVQQSFFADFYMTLYWIDPRVNQSFYANGATWQDWHPVLDFPNEVGVIAQVIPDPYFFEPIPENFYGGPVPNGTWITYDQRFQGTFFTPFDLKNFPYDEV